MDDSYKQNIEQKNPKAKESAYDPTYVNFQSKQNKSMVGEDAYPWTGGTAVSVGASDGF